MDANGRPLLYYGRIYAQNRAQAQMFDLFFFLHAAVPFFDEYAIYKNLELGITKRDAYFEGSWDYAIATGIQWNILIKNPGLVAAIEINPTIKKDIPHPHLDQLTTGQPNGSLNIEQLAKQGFSFPALPIPQHILDEITKKQVAGIGVQSSAFFDWFVGAITTVIDIIKAPFELAIDLVTEVVKGGIDALNKLVRLAIQGVSAAIDALRKLGNAVVCEIAGRRPNEGRVFVYDPLINGPALFGVKTFTTEPEPIRNRMKPEPIRNARIFARGGPGGILLTDAEINDEGFYRLENLCSDFKYNVRLDLNGSSAFITSDGVFADDVGLGEVGVEQRASQWVVDHSKARWFIGAQLGRKVAAQNFGFVPKQVKIISGFIVDNIIGQLGNSTSVTACGHLAILGAVVPFIGVWLDGDIYAHKSSLQKSDLIGVSLHEYGHFTMCEAIKRNGGNLERFLNVFLLNTIFNKVGDLILSANFSLNDPVRSAAESFADYFSYSARGYTDYFGNNGSSQNCSLTDVADQQRCLENDRAFQLDGHEQRDYPDQKISSTASILYDITDNNVGSFDLPQDDALHLNPSLLGWAMAQTSPTITITAMTHALTLGIFQTPAASAEEMCQIYQNHGWNCSGVSTAGIQLTAPNTFTGRATHTDEILWSWAPSSLLADSYSVLQANNNGWTEVNHVNRNTFQFSQKILNARPNQPVTAVVESRLNGAQPGRSQRIRRCTMAAPVKNVRLLTTLNGIQLDWDADEATDYVIYRSQAEGSFMSIATVNPSSGTQSYTDLQAGPNLKLNYQINSRNCDQVETSGPVVSGTTECSDATCVYVTAGSINGDGSKQKPFGTISQALKQLSVSRQRVLVSEGVYPERLITTQGIPTSIYGGYNSSFNEYNPKKYTTYLVGDNSETIYRTGGEISDKIRPLILLPWYDGKSNFLLNGITIDPTKRTCTGSDCYAMNFILCGAASLVNVTWLGLPGREPQNYEALFTRIAHLNIVDSILDSKLLTVKYLCDGCDQTNITNSTLFTDIDVHNLNLDRAVIVGQINARLELNIANSIIHGGIKSSFFNASRILTHSLIIADPSYGKTELEKANLIANNIFLSTRDEPLLSFVEKSSYLSGITIKNNLFVSGSSLQFAQTQQRIRMGLPPIGPSDLNNATAWFNSSANEISGNLYFSDRAGLFEDDRPAGTVGHYYHPKANSAWLNQGADLTKYGINLRHDLDGKPRPPGEFHIGPYH